MAGSVYEGKTYDEAVKKGLEALRLTRAEAVITTVEEGKGGFLGIGSRPFRVSVARRPGGAIREPSERAGEDRRGKRGGREERSTSTRGGRRSSGERTREAHAGGRPGGEERSAASRGRGGRDRAAAGGAHPRRGADEPAAEPKPSARSGRSESPSAGEERPSGGRSERSRRGGERSGHARRDEPAREPGPAREVARPLPQAAEPHPAPPAIAGGAGDEGDGRKRRRRGRRGGRGRRRSPGGPEGAELLSGTPALNGRDAGDFGDEGEGHESPGFVEATPASYETGLEAPPPTASHAPLPEATPSGDAPWAAAPTQRNEPEAEPSYAARDTMPALRPSRGDRGERHRARPESTPDMNVDELSSTSRRLTEELLRAMGFEPKVSVRAEGNRVDVTIEVDRHDELLNGHQGDTRQAIQHLLNRFLNKGDGSRYHLQLEINDHWHHRETELEELAHRLADEAASRQVEVVSDHLSSQERRIVHMTLREDSRVKTYSLGDGAVKRVAVAPATFPDRSEDEPAS
jgi:predicted RNA-binding protein Jag